MAKMTFNILAIVGAAGFSGVMLCIGVTLGSYWRTLPPELFLEWFAQNNQYISRAVSLIFLPTFIGMAGSLWIAFGSPAFKYWLLSMLCIVVILFLTFGYFVPTNTMFSGNGISVSLVPDKLNQWLLIHNARISLAAIAAVIGILAVSIRQ